MRFITTHIRRTVVLAAAVAMLLGVVTGPTIAQADTPAGNSALAWTQAQEGSANWDGMCLQLMQDAYSQAGIDLTTLAGDSSSAVSWWNSYGGTKYPPSDAPPAGALVFWGATDTNPYGHVAISEGNGMAVSSEERSYTGVHELTIANRDAQGYQQLGYVIPG